MNPNLLILIPLLPLFGFLINGTSAFVQATGRKGLPSVVTSFVACLAPFAAFILALLAFWDLRAHPDLPLAYPNIFSWMALSQIEISFGYVLDPLSSVMMLVVTGVGFLIHLYSTAYMHEDEAYARYMAYINLFLFFMSNLVMADSLPLLFVGWEGVGLCSYLLIGFWFTDKEKAVAGKKAFITNRIGDFCFLIGMFAIVAVFAKVPLARDAGGLLGKNFLDIQFILANKDYLAPTVTFITLAFFFGAAGKSAQIPLYVWLPDAMAGPTPVSALIHAATMVTAGIYLVARLGALFVMSPFTMNVVLTVGLATALLAALMAVVQTDIKKVLAYSTVSQLGYMVMALGVGAFSAAIFHVVTHAFFKACLFLGAGSVIHALHHEQDVQHMGGLLKRMPITGLTFLISTLAIAGVPPLSGFFSKDEILYMVYANAPKAYYILALMTAGLTAFYMMRVFALTFLGRTRYAHPDHIHESPLAMTLPLIVLAILAALAGFMGLPHVFAKIAPNYFSNWLEFLGQHTPHHLEGPLQESHLMGISAGWGALCLLASWVIYTRVPDFADKIRRVFQPLYCLMAAKFYVDEIYQFVFIRPIHFLSQVFLFKGVDRVLIDSTAVGGVSSVTRLAAHALSLLHTGVVSHYLFYFLLGTIFVIGLFVKG